MQNEAVQKRGKIMAQKKHSTGEPKYPIAYLIPLIMVLALIPLIVYMYRYDPGLTDYDWYSGPVSTFDFFLHAKTTWLYITLIGIIFLMLFMIFSDEIAPVWDKLLIPLLVYCGLCLISVAASVNKHFSLTGIYAQFESVWILLGYGLLVYFAFYVLNSETAIRRLMPWFLAGITIMAVIGISQALNHDILKLPALQNLIFTDKSYIGKTRSNFEDNRVYLTLYNPNYVGCYVAMIIPVLIAILMHAKKLALRIFCCILCVALLVALFASQSRAGILALAVTFFLMLLCMRKVFLKNWIVTASIIAVAIVGFIGANILSHNVLLNRMATMFHSEKETYDLEGISCDKDVTFYYQGNALHITAEAGEDGVLTFTLTDQEGSPVAFTAGEGETPNRITDPRFPFTFKQFTVDSFKGFQVTTSRTEVIDGAEQTTAKDWFFSNQMFEGDKSYYYKGSGNSFFHIKKDYDGVAFLDERYHLANGRGYIWSRTLPLLKKYFFLGSGPDTFIIAFPNDDVTGLYNSGHDGELITRPHCMYLQIAVQTGVPSLIAFLIFFGWYILRSLKLYWNADYSGYLPKLGLGVLAGVIGYLILGITNDSCVAVSPIFFVLTGMGLGINYRLRKEQVK